MPDWTPFYTGLAGAAATLSGLLFIGVQFNIDAVVGEANSRWQAVARSTFSIFVVVLLMSYGAVIVNVLTASAAHQSPNNEYAAYSLIALFAIALRNSWDLLVELSYEIRQKAGRR